MKHTVIALVQDRPGVLNRVASIFRRRSLNIESLTVARTAESGVSQMTLVADVENVGPVLAQLEKLIDVFEVSAVETQSAQPHRFETSSAMLAVQADGAAQ